MVVASNFAPGTTAADIESVMRGVGGEILYCRLVAATPTVIAEMGFPELVNADKVIATFNNKKVSCHLVSDETFVEGARTEANGKYRLMADCSTCT